MGRVVLAGGGTGGHVYPALAMGDVLRERGWDVVVYGDPARLEGRVAPARGYELRKVEGVAFPRGRGWRSKARFVIGLGRAVWQARRLLRRDRVDAVLGVGGYLAAPTVLAAWTCRIPVVVHESNAVPGLANRLCARVAREVLVVFEETRRHLPARTPVHRVGMPVSGGVARGERSEAATRYGLSPHRKTVLVMGGSLGAASLNELAVALERTRPAQVQILHLCGPIHAEEVRARLPQPGDGYRLVPYEDRIADAYAMADLVVCRAGSGTLAELALVGKPAVLVPSPHVTDHHQDANAAALASVGAAIALDERSWDVERVADQVVGWVQDDERLGSMSAAMAAQAMPDAAEDAVARLLRCL